ncbi:MAG TPA: AAA family ATPase [bacterium]|nr:AAA family ATPase [bacterium]
MSFVISVVNQKGGVGKTTTSVNVAAYLAKAGNKVLLIDLDPQGNASTSLGVDVYDNEARSVYNLLVENLRAVDVIFPSNQENLFVIPSNINLSGASIELVNLPDREFRLSQKLKNVENNFDYIIIDCPPSLGLLTINALVASKYVLIPVQAEYYALEGLGQLVQTIDLVKSYLRADLEILGAVLTMYDKRNRLSRDIRYDLERNFPHRVMETIIPRNVRLSEAPSYSQTIADYDAGSPGARAYSWLASEIISTLSNQPINVPALENQLVAEDGGENVVNNEETIEESAEENQ